MSKTVKVQTRVYELSKKAAVKAGLTFERIWPSWPKIAFSALDLRTLAAMTIHEFALPIITRTRNDEVSTSSRSDRSDVLCTSGDG